MSFFGKAGTVRSRSRGRAVLLVGVVVAALTWSGMLPPLSEWVWKTDAVMRDQLSLILTPPKERDDLVFLGMDDEMRRQTGLDPAEVRQSRALTLMRQEVGNERLDRRIFADLIERLASAGVKLIILDVLFMGPSGSAEADREFAEVLQRHHDKIVMSMFLQNIGEGDYQPVSSVEQLPHLGDGGERSPHEGYVNLWPDAGDNHVRRLDYTLTLGELKTGERQAGERVYESLAATAGRLLGARLPEERAPRLRYAGAGGSDSTYSSAYAPHSLHKLFVAQRWKNDYADGEFFRDKVVLVSSATVRDEDYHVIPGAVIYGGQFHLQALGSVLENNYWQEAPQWVNLAALLGMAMLAVGIGMALRHPAAVLLASLAVALGFLVMCGWVSSYTGVLFAGTPGLLGLAMVTIGVEIGHLVVMAGERQKSTTAAKQAPAPAV